MTVEILNNIYVNIENDNVIFTDALSPSEENNLCKSTHILSSIYNFSLNDLSIDADASLTKDSNANLPIDQSEIINYSSCGSIKSESINHILEKGNYYRSSFNAKPLDLGGDTLTEAYKLENEATVRDRLSHLFSNRIGALDLNDYYQFTLDGTSDIDLVLSDFDSNIDVQLLNADNKLISSSRNLGFADESIIETLEAGNDYINVYSYSGSETDYTLTFSTIPYTTSPLPTSSSASPLPTASNKSIAISPIPQSVNNSTPHIQGTFGADTFIYQPGEELTIFSGNGNYSYSSEKDTLDLSGYAFNTVKTNYVKDRGIGGVIHDPDPNDDEGARVFDVIELPDGNKIYFENIEVVQFKDRKDNLSVRPNDPLFDNQWNLHMTGVHNAWRFTEGNNDVLMGIVDTGLGTDSNGNIHPDLQSRNTIFAGDNYLDEWEGFSHGTPIQGTMGATANNSQGIAGINWNSPIYTIDVMGSDSGDYDLVTAVQKIINQANAQEQLAVINMSLVDGYSTELEQVIAENQNNALFVIASGNNGDNHVASPANLAAKYDNVIAVGASWGATDYYRNPTTPGQRIDYSHINWWGSNFGNALTLMAPSEFITTYSTIDPYSGFHTHYYYNDYRSSGTSISTAMVSGIASLVWSIDKNLTAGDIKSILSETAILPETATNIDANGKDIEHGHGLVNADAAVRRAMAISRGSAQSINIMTPA